MGICASSAVRDVLAADDAPPPLVVKSAPSATTRAPAVRPARVSSCTPPSGLALVKQPGALHICDCGSSQLPCVNPSRTPHSMRQMRC